MIVSFFTFVQLFLPIYLARATKFVLVLGTVITSSKVGNRFRLLLTASSPKFKNMPEDCCSGSG